MTSVALQDSPVLPSVIVCTRDRAPDLRRCLHSILASKTRWREVIVVDQSVDDDTASVVAGLALKDAGVRYIRTAQTGLSAARNEGARLATSSLLMFTDDDCEVADSWLQEWPGLFGSDRALGIGFGRVTTPEFDPRHGHIPHFIPTDGERSYGLKLFRRGAEHVGMGANMVVRREAWAAVGGFDEVLGAGSTFPAAEDIDLALRVVRSGYRLIHTNRAVVVHHGYREARDASRLARGYATATAAMYVKHVRCGERGSAVLLGCQIAHLGRRVVRSCVTGERPTGLNSLVAFVSGIGASRDYPIDGARGVYLSPR